MPMYSNLVLVPIKPQDDPCVPARAAGIDCSYVVQPDGTKVVSIGGFSPSNGQYVQMTMHIQPAPQTPHVYGQELRNTTLGNYAIQQKTHATPADPMLPAPIPAANVAIPVQVAYPSNEEYAVWAAFLRRQTAGQPIPISIEELDEEGRVLDATKFHHLGVAAVLVNADHHPYGLPTTRFGKYELGMVTFRSPSEAVFKVSQQSSPQAHSVWSVKSVKTPKGWVEADRVLLTMS